MANALYFDAQLTNLGEMCHWLQETARRGVKIAKILIFQLLRGLIAPLMAHFPQKKFFPFFGSTLPNFWAKIHYFVFVQF